MCKITPLVLIFLSSLVLILLYFSSLSLFFPRLHFLYLFSKFGGTWIHGLSIYLLYSFGEDMFFVEFSTAVVWVVSPQKVCSSQGSRDKILVDFRLAPNPKTGVLVSGRDTCSETERRRRSCDKASRDGSYAAISQGIPGATRSWKRPGGIFPSYFRRAMALPTAWFQTSGFQNCKRINVCCLKPLGHSN